MKESLSTASSMERDETALVLKNIQFALVQENMKTASSFINVFSGRRNLFCAKLLYKKLSAGWSSQAGKIILTAGQFAWCLALYETCALHTVKSGIGAGKH